MKVTPRLPIRLACALAPADVREALAGDLTEEYHARCIVNERQAGRWVWRQAASSVLSFLGLHAGRRGGAELGVLLLGVLTVELCFRIYNQPWFLDLVRGFDAAGRPALVVSLNLAACGAGGLLTAGLAIRGGYRETVVLALLLAGWSIVAQGTGGTVRADWVVIPTGAVAAGGWIGARARHLVQSRLSVARLCR